MATGAPRPEGPPPERELAAQRRELAQPRDETAPARERWEGLFRLAPVALVVTDRSGVVMEANTAAGELLNEAPRQLVGAPLAHFLEGRDIADEVGRVGRDVRRLYLTVRPAHDSPPRRVEVRVRRLDEHGLAGGVPVVWTFHDVEQREAGRERLARRAAELERRAAARSRELEVAQALTQSILARLPVGVIVASAPGGRVIAANDRIRQILGHDPVGARWPDDFEEWTIHAPGGDAAYSPGAWPLTAAVRSGETAVERVVLERRGREPVVLDVRAAPIRDADGRIAFGAAVVEDATERERHERAQRDFVANAAHELQTPLAAIISAAEVLDAGAKEEPEDRDRFLAHIRRECDRLTRLVHALLTLARAQAQAEEPLTEELRLRPLLDGVALSLAAAPGVEVRVDCPARLTARANRLLLEQAVAGLGGNAAKYTADGRIWLRARRGRDGAVEVEVADEGPGIPAGDEEQLFARFYRGGARDATGFGLGLAIVREAVEALGGRVELLPRRPRGTSARIVLPERRPA